MEEKLMQLKHRLRDYYDMHAIAELLYWDQSVNMPPGGAEARARQLALLEKEAHEKLTNPVVGQLLDDLADYQKSLPEDSDDARYLVNARREYDKEARLPLDFVERSAQHLSAIYEAWAKARPANDFAAVQPLLEKSVELSLEYSSYFPGYEHVADPLIDRYDFGMKASIIQPLFADLREKLVPIVKSILDQEPPDDRCLHQHFPIAKQKQFGSLVAKQLGYDFERGREDESPHPFTCGFSQDDIRITSRFSENEMVGALFGTIHETGHAVYEQGIDPAYEASPLGGGTSAGVHESQSRLWENQVGRSRDFWVYFYPKLQEFFPEQFNTVSLDTFYRAINKSAPTLIRTESDEVTYNLHIMIRFDLELAMLEGKLAIKDLPDAWNARYQSDLGVTPGSDKNGVLQDIHWYGGYIGGAFQGYTLGNIMSAQFFAAAKNALPDLSNQIQKGEFAPLLNWLRHNIYVHGSKYKANELVQRISGGSISIGPYIDYLRTKFGELYRL